MFIYIFILNLLSLTILAQNETLDETNDLVKLLTKENKRYESQKPLLVFYEDILPLPFYEDELYDNEYIIKDVSLDYDSLVTEHFSDNDTYQINENKIKSINISDDKTDENNEININFLNNDNKLNQNSSQNFEERVNSTSGTTKSFLETKFLFFPLNNETKQISKSVSPTINKSNDQFIYHTIPISERNKKKMIINICQCDQQDDNCVHWDGNHMWPKIPFTDKVKDDFEIEIIKTEFKCIFKSEIFQINEISVRKNAFVVSNKTVDFNSEYCFQAAYSNKMTWEINWQVNFCNKTIGIPICCSENQMMSVHGCQSASNPFLKFALTSFYYRYQLRPLIKMNTCQDNLPIFYEIEYRITTLNCNSSEVRWIDPEYDTFNTIYLNENLILGLNSSYRKEFCLSSLNAPHDDLSSNLIFYCQRNFLESNITTHMNIMKNKCCPIGYFLRGTTCVCEEQLLKNEREVFLRKRIDFLKNNSTVFNHFPSCEFFETTKMGNRSHLENFIGQLVRENQSFCVENQFNYLNSETSIVVLKCFEDDEIKINLDYSPLLWSLAKFKFQIISACLVISSISLIAILLSHIFIKSLRDLHGIILCSYVGSLLIADLSLFTMLVFSKKLCFNCCLINGKKIKILDVLVGPSD